jgi:dynein heavy chain, axonemal
LTVTLRQEIDCLNAVIKLTKWTLSNLRLAIAGSVALSGDLIDALDALFNARIPASWLGKSWQASTLGNWFTGLLQRFDQLSKWINTGRPRSFWLTGFFNPQGFLTAMKQEVGFTISLGRVPKGCQMPSNQPAACLPRLYKPCL